MSSRNLRFAIDRSMRRVDDDGHMHIEMANISKANVCPYYGREIPDFEALGLDANRVYRLYRDPSELKAGAASFAGKPLLLHHIPVSADEPAQELVVGSIGTAVAFDGTYLKAPLSVWTQEAINVVESEEQRELSPGYRYRADMTPGRSPEGVAYDGVMRDIRGNHLALVKTGRTGPDVVVPDAMPLEFPKMKFRKAVAALAALFPTAPAPAQLAAVDAALDADLDDKAAMDALSDEERTAACDSWAKEKGKALDALTDEDKAEAYKRAAADKKGAPHAATQGRQPAAADEATVQLAVDAAVAAAVAQARVGMVTQVAADTLAQDAATAARAEVHALYAARKAVETTVGVVALDSAEAVYRFALDHLKVEHKDIPAVALPALYEASSKVAAPPAPFAHDSAPFDPSILGLSHISKG